MERKIDEVFKEDGKVIKVVEATEFVGYCDCYFNMKILCKSPSNECRSTERLDHKNVIFKEIK